MSQYMESIPKGQFKCVPPPIIPTKVETKSYRNPVV